MKKVKIEEAIGLELLHDITEIDIKKNFKGIAFSKGHILKKEDIPKLKKIGKRYIYVKDPFDDNLVHENDAALLVSPIIAGSNITFSEKPKEGKINFYANIDGLLKINENSIIKINRLEIPSLPTIHNNYPVKKGQLVAAFRIIPLFCEKIIIDKIKNILKKPPIKVLPYKIKTASIIVTGNEVYNGLIEDKFIPIIKKKLSQFNVKVINNTILPDDKVIIKNKIIDFLKNSDILFITGGTSVDPDDMTKDAMKEAGVKIIQEGNPIQPGNNFTLGYYNKKPVCAVPAATIFFKNTALDIFLPRLLANDKISKKEIAKYSIGGLCHFCKKCVFPMCPFGK